MLTETEFQALAEQGYNRIPLVLETFADLDTPLSLYLKLAHQHYTFLLESVVGGERFGRYSFIGLPAKIRIRVKGSHVEVEDNGGVVALYDGIGVPSRSCARSSPASARRHNRGCRVFAAGSPATSGTTPSATSSRSSPVIRPVSGAHSTICQTCC